MPSGRGMKLTKNQLPLWPSRVAARLEAGLSTRGHAKATAHRIKRFSAVAPQWHKAFVLALLNTLVGCACRPLRKREKIESSGGPFSKLVPVRIEKLREPPGLSPTRGAAPSQRSLTLRG
uniref:Uncharacterized protein n=1 Tax=Trypanosoma congolense (strain IL3000) TaxID=1068625 RepID=G0UMD8_TRYCI|nr:hypothetical protein, unlikely [Trypanosoma congolense IL3000]